MRIWILTNKGKEEFENTRLIEEFTARSVNVELVKPEEFDLVISKHTDNNIYSKNVCIHLPDGVLVRTGSGSKYHSFSVMRQFESYNIPVINNSNAINTVMDKLETMQRLAGEGIPIPKTMAIRFPINNDIVDKEIGYPCIVKVVTGSYGTGVYLCDTKKSFDNLMELLKTLNVKKTLIIQEYVNTRVGTDLRVWVIGSRVIGAMLRCNKTDFRANISHGGVGESYPLNQDIINIASNTASTLGLDIAGVDLLFDGNSFKVCEANSAPGFEGFEQYCKVNIAALVAEYMIQTVHINKRIN